MSAGGDAGNGLASVVVPCWNQRAFTRACVAALLRHTRAPWELILVDNGSDDGTDAYAEGVRDAAAVSSATAATSASPPPATRASAPPAATTWSS